MRTAIFDLRMPWLRRTQVRVAVAAAAATLTAIIAIPALAEPTRIVSVNLCTDQLLLLLADRARIVSVSYLSVDPNASAMAEAAQGLKLNHGLAEEILPLKPDLVLAGIYTTRPTVFLLQRLGYRVVELPVAATFDDIRTNIRTAAGAIEERERGEALIATFDRELASPTAPNTASAPVAALYWANSYSSGRGTLADAVVRHAGFRNLAGELGVSGSAQLPLETLLVSEPDLLVIGRQRDGAALANEHLHHPALRKAFADRATVSIPDRFWVCGTPFVADAVRLLRAARENVVNPLQIGKRR